MGAYTFSNFQDYLLVRLGNNTAFQTPTNYLSVWVNAAYRRLCNMEKVPGMRGRIYFPELEADTTSGTADGVVYVSVPSNCLAVREVFDETNAKRLDWIHWSRYIGFTDRLTNTAEPNYWHRAGSRIYIYPTPGGSYTVRIYYRRKPTSLSLSTDVTLLGSEWDDVILEFATMIAWNWQNQPEKAEYAKKEAFDLISPLVGVYDSEEKARRESIEPDQAYINKDSY